MIAKYSSILAKAGGLLLLALAPSGSQAGLIYENINGHDFIFDTTQQITWTRDADLTNSTYTWQDANTWASKLSIDGINTQGWHLPNVTQFTSLYTQLYPFGEPGTQDAKYVAQVFFGIGANDFAANVRPAYWTDASQTDFNFSYGYGGNFPNDTPYSAWAVAVVPEPSTLSLLALGLIGVLAQSRHRRPILFG